MTSIEGKGWLTDEEYREIYNKVPRACVDMIILVPSTARDDAGIVLTQRKIEPYKGCWHLPGGGIRYGELVEEAADRHSKKELNVTVKIEDTIGFITNPEEEKLGYGWPVSIVVEASISDGTLTDSSEGDFGIFNINNLPESMIPTHRDFLKTHFKKKRFT